MADLQAEMARFEAEVAEVSQVPSQSPAKNISSGPPLAQPNFSRGPPAHPSWGRPPPGPPGQMFYPGPNSGGYPGPPSHPQSYPGPPRNSYHASSGPVSSQASYSGPPQQTNQYGSGPVSASAISQADLSAVPEIAQPQTYAAVPQGIPIQTGDAKVLAAAQSASIVQPGKRQSEVYSNIQEAFASQKASKKPRYGVAREAAGKKWIDPGLLEWPENDFRIFVGDLGNETNDEVLTKAFAKYPTFNKAKVVRDKKSNKTRGFGFVSFSDPIEGAKALKEMDGKYVGNRPCKLKKSSWGERNQEEQKFVPGRKKNHIFGGAANSKKGGVLHK